MTSGERDTSSRGRASKDSTAGVTLGLVSVPDGLANATAEIVIALAILLWSDRGALVAMPALAGLLILFGYRTFKVDQVRLVW